MLVSLSQCLFVTPFSERSIASLFRFHTSEQILEETARNLAKILAKRQKIDPKKALEKAQRRVKQMKQAFPESLVEPKQEIIDILTNDPKDRHVLAAAIEAQADIIVTSNLKDFPNYALEPYQIKAVSPDDFLVNLVNLFGSLKLLEILQQQASDLDFELSIILSKLRRQPFSIAGYQKGFRDERGNLFFEIMRLAKYLKPKVIFLENVKNLKGHNQGRTFQIIQDCLQAHGYWVHDQVLNTCEFSRLPQNRERLYIVAFQQKKAFEAFAYPDKIEDTESPQTFLNDEVDEVFYYTNSKYYPEIKPEMTSPNSIYQWRRVYLRENKSGVCPTLTANMGTGGNNVPLIVDNKGIRKLTPRECLRFQGFPDDFREVQKNNDPNR